MFQSLSFHEATVVRLEREGNGLCICLEGVTQSDGSKSAGCLNLKRVSRIEVDERVVDDIGMEAADGEIIDLEVACTEVTAIVQWNDFVPRKSVTRHYRVVFALAEWFSEYTESR